jgi:VanZ family protein
VIEPRTTPARRLFALAMLVAYAVLIFGQSSGSAPDAILALEVPDFALHALEYAVLGFLASRWLLHQTLRTGARVLVLAPALIATLYGVTDEIHQAFVPEREGAAADVLADAVGGLAGAFLYRHLLIHRLRRGAAAAAACLLVLPGALLPDLGADVARELAAAKPADRVAVLEKLPARMAERPAAERAALAPLLVRLLRDRERVHLHAALMRPLVMTATEAGVREVLVRAYEREATPLRASARAALTEEGGEDVTKVVPAFLRRDRSPRARAILAGILGRRGDRAATGVLLAALRDPAPMVRVAAAEALTRIHGRCGGYDPDGWTEIVARKPIAGLPPAPEPPPRRPKKPGDVVTVPAPPRETDVEAEVGRLVPDFFGVPLDRPVVVAVLDFSASVRGPGGDRVRRLLGRSLSLLPSIRKFTVLAFDERLLHLRPAPEPALPDLKEELVRFLDRLPPGQRTELLMPLRAGLALAEKHEGAGAQVLLVSDGAPTVPGPPLEELLERAEALLGKNVRVDAAVHGGREVGLFRYLTRLTGGRYVALPSPR